jgi:hypothetical protein
MRSVAKKYIQIKNSPHWKDIMPFSIPKRSISGPGAGIQYIYAVKYLSSAVDEELAVGVNGEFVNARLPRLPHSYSGCLNIRYFATDLTKYCRQDRS